VKVVLDTNVILAGFATRGLCEAVLAVCFDRHEIALSNAILSEVQRHLSGKFNMPAARVQEIIKFLQQHATIVTPIAVADDACRDPEDLPVLGTAIAATADCLITGDKDLLSIGKIQEIPILSPRAFYDELGGSASNAST
jgi:putative PIN family toxin of toxin-antitoxin system